MKQYLIEFIGTFFLVFAIAMSGGSPFQPFAIGLTLALAVYLGGHISGAHYNPAVTLALLIRKKISSNDAAFYMMSQLLGAIVAVFVASWFGKKFLPEVGIGFTDFQAIIAEMICTFLLCSVVLATAASEKTKGNFIYGFAIGLSVTVSALMIGNITGAALNPAVFIAAMLRTTNFTEIWVYLIGTLGGGALAGVLHQYFEKN